LPSSLFPAKRSAMGHPCRARAPPVIVYLALPLRVCWAARISASLPGEVDATDDFSGGSGVDPIWWDERVSCDPTFFITQNGKSQYYEAVAASIKSASSSIKFADWLWMPSTIMTSNGTQLNELIWSKLEENENFRVYIYTYEMSFVNPVTGKWGPFHTGVAASLRDFVKDKRSKNRVSILFASGRKGRWEQFWSCHMKAVSFDDREMYLGGVEWLDERVPSFKGYVSWEDLQARIPGGETVAHFTEVYESMWRTFCDDPDRPSASGSCDAATLEGLRADKNRRIDQAPAPPATGGRSTYCSLELTGGHARLGPELLKGGLRSHMGENREGSSHDNQEAIYQTYLKALKTADTALIEDQYFSSGFVDAPPGQMAKNVLMSALQQTRSAKIIIPLSSAGAVPTYRSMVQWKKRQWRLAHNGHSVKTRGRFNGYNVDALQKLDTLESPRVDFFFLLHAEAGDKFEYIKLDQKFVHSKGLIALGVNLEYPLAVVGSANINDRSLLADRDAEISVRIEGDGVTDLFAEKIAWYLAVTDDWVRRIMRGCTQSWYSQCCKRVASDFLKSNHPTHPGESEFTEADRGGVVDLLERRGLRVDDAPDAVVGEGAARSAYERIAEMTRKVGEVEQLPSNMTMRVTHLVNRLWHHPDMLGFMSSLAMLNADLLAAVSGGEVDVLRKGWHEVGKGPKFDTWHETLISFFKPSQERRLKLSPDNDCFELPVDALLLPFRLGLMKDMRMRDLKSRISEEFSVLEVEED